ncbi:MAG: hypothetical protein BGO31_07925 [Bacteroidetes bacterium 43-16]|uniref:hypothetical protein n=1 Tax=uncultured Dysgonomonas sp. TaxID=206096 RepID=UPI00092AF2A3|nr:hypothetical protein [uncultured Dysgonomonas sp.]OJV51232.1 MAG: hypothetical protein BGO31_07925 [Bacteroidetes bacterium 43-16]
MIDVIVNNIKIPLQNIWYHKKNNFRGDQHYKIILNRNIPEIEAFFQEYTNHNIVNEEILSVIKDKEKQLGSMGLIWHLIQYFNKFEIDDVQENKDKPYYMFNSLDSIKIEGNRLVLEGRFCSNGEG